MPKFNPLYAPLPFFNLPAPELWPVHAGSVRDPVTFAPLPKKKAAQIWHRARDFDRKTHTAGRHGGAIGHIGLKVLYTLLFEFLNYTSGRLDPSYDAIARKANVCRSAIAEALKRLKALGLLSWIRRCKETRDEGGRFVLEQETNAYAVLPPSCWKGYTEPPPPPQPHASTWGACPPLPDCLTQSLQAAKEGAPLAEQITALEQDDGDGLAAALARLGRAMIGAQR